MADSTYFSATATSSASVGTHTLTVTSLATFQRQVADQGYASSSDLTFGTGTITITGGDSPVEVTIGEGSNSLSGIAAAINASDANITASLINDGSSSPYRLVLYGKDTNNYTIDSSALSGGTSENPTFTQDPDSATYVAGSAAQFTLDGIEITKTSNTVSDVIPGVTLNLLKAGTSSVSIGYDTEAVTTKINAFVSSYNDAMGLLNKYSAYDSTTKTAGVLSGDSTVRSLRSSLQSLISTPVSGVDEAYSLLSQIGITSSYTDGTLTIDATKLAAALADNPDAVAELFTHNSGVSDLESTDYGLTGRFTQKLDLLTHAYVGSSSSDNGTIATRVHGLQTRISDIDERITSMERLLTQKEENLTKQFAAMEQLVSNISTGAWGSLLTTLGNMTTS